MTDPKKMKVTFAPGAFDAFEGTQEELDKLVSEIETMFTELTPDELMERSRSVNLSELDDDILEKIAEKLDLLENEADPKGSSKLH